MKEGRVKEITDVRDEIDLSGFKLTIDVRRGTDPDALMKKLYKLTPLEDDFGCNFNVLIDSAPRQLGVVGILKEYRRESGLNVFVITHRPEVQVEAFDRMVTVEKTGGASRVSVAEAG